MKNFIDSFKNLFYGKINASLTKEDLYNSKYISLYNHHRRKRPYREILEQNTLIMINEVLKEGFPKRITKEAKNEMADCTVIFLKWISTNYDYYPSKSIYETEFNRIVKKNIEKFKTN